MQEIIVDQELNFGVCTFNKHFIYDDLPYRKHRANLEMLLWLIHLFNRLYLLSSQREKFVQKFNGMLLLVFFVCSFPNPKKQFIIFLFVQIFKNRL